MNRKDFLRLSALAVAGLAVGPAFIESCKKANTGPQGPTVNFTLDLAIAANQALNTVGGYLYSNGVIVVRLSNDNLGFVAVAQTCTHQGCTIAWNASSITFICPCHGGQYNVNGDVVAGPPPNPVKKYTITRDKNVLTIKG